jgi:hypothetical protein
MKRAAFALLGLALVALAAWAQVGYQPQPGVAPPGSYLIVQSATGVWRLDTRYGELRHCTLSSGGEITCGAPAAIPR